MGSNVLKGQCGAGISTSEIPVVPVRVRVDYLEVIGSIQTLMSLAFCLLPQGRIHRIQVIIRVLLYLGALALSV